MLMLLCVPQAFVTAAAADFGAEAEHHFHDDRFIRNSATYAKNTRGATHYRTVQIHADAVAQLSKRFFSQTCIGTGDACLSAIEARFCRAEGKFIDIAASRGMSF